MLTMPHFAVVRAHGWMGQVREKSDSDEQARAGPESL